MIRNNNTVQCDMREMGKGGERRVRLQVRVPSCALRGRARDRRGTMCRVDDGASAICSEIQARVVGDPSECLGAGRGNGWDFQCCASEDKRRPRAGGGVGAVDGAGERRRGHRRAPNLARSRQSGQAPVDMGGEGLHS